MIIGKRVRLRAVERTDLPRFVQWLNDPDVIPGLLIVTPMSMAQEERWFDRMLSGPAEEAPLVIEANLENGWTPIGNLGLHRISWREREAELGIFIGEKTVWNQGLGGDALRLLLDYGFNKLNLNRIFLRVHANNPRAIRSYEKVGFIHEGRLREAHFSNGEYVDVLIMSVLRSEWKNNLD